MDIEQAAALFRTAQSNWPVVTFSQNPRYATLVIGVGTREEPVTVIVTAQDVKRFADVEIISKHDTIDSPAILAKLGGVLIQVGNLVEQANALAGGT